MSARNGDKSRFNRIRKQNIARRQRTIALLERMRTQSASAGAPQAPPKAVTA
jgi:hypothetical protein